MGGTETSRAGQAVSNKWWILIFLLAAELPLLVVLYVFSRTFITPMPLTSSFGWVFFELTRLGILLSVVSILAVHFDRQYAASVSDWHPSRLYYLMAVPTLVNVGIAIAYLYDRHRHIGTP